MFQREPQTPPRQPDVVVPQLRRRPSRVSRPSTPGVSIPSTSGVSIPSTSGVSIPSTSGVSRKRPSTNSHGGSNKRKRRPGPAERLPDGEFVMPQTDSGDLDTCSSNDD